MPQRRLIVLALGAGLAPGALRAQAPATPPLDDTRSLGSVAARNVVCERVHCCGRDRALSASSASQPGPLRRSARRVNQGSKCTKPADMPVEQPRVVELDVNMRAARALGVAVPQSLLLRADRGTE